MRYGVSGFSGDYFTSHLKTSSKSKCDCNSWSGVGRELLGSALDIGMILAMGAMTKSASAGPSKKAVNANAVATVANSTKQIATLNQAFMQKYGTTVDTQTGNPQKTLAMMKAETQAEIDRLKSSIGVEKDAKTGVESKNEDYEAYKVAMQSVDGLNQAANQVEAAQKALVADGAAANCPDCKSQYHNTVLIVGGEGQEWRVNDSVTAKTYAEAFKYPTDTKSKDYAQKKANVDQARARAFEADKGKARNRCEQHNVLVQQLKQAEEGAKAFNGQQINNGGHIINITAFDATSIRTAANDAKSYITQNMNQVHKGPNGAVTTTASAYDAQLSKLNAKMAMYSDSAQFDTDVKEIKGWIAKRNEAQALVDAEQNMKNAKADKKLASKGAAKKAAKANYKDAAQMYQQLLASRRAAMTDDA